MTQDQERSNNNNKSEQLNRSGKLIAASGRSSLHHHPPSNVIHIMHLTRPFTVNQLKELLQKYGTFKINEKKEPREPYFWIDAVKSHCYVAYESQAEAEQARQALHNINWPASNPKQLSVDFSSMDDIVSIIESDGKVTVSGKAAATNGDENRGRDKDRKVREWDLPKLKDAEAAAATTNGGKATSNNRSSSGGKNAMDVEPPKQLEDLFRKTNASPSIYWLPLSEEQVLEKIKMEEKRRIEKEARLAQSRALEEVKREKVLN